MIPGERIDEFVKRIRDAGGPNLQSIILYGSAASGDFHSDLSDINLLCIVHDTSLRVLEALAPVIKWWTRRQPSSPLFMTRNELERSSDVFAIEFLDMRQRYRVLYGDDVLKDLDISMAHHRAQLEYELREKLLLLRQKFLLLGSRERQLKALLLESVPSF